MPSAHCVERRLALKACSAHADCRSRIFKQRHEPEIHVQLLVTVKERRPGVVREEVSAPKTAAWEEYRTLGE